MYHTTTFMAALARCVNLLGDADSTGAILGQIAGAFYGIDRIDGRLIDRLTFMYLHMCREDNTTFWT